MFLDATKSWAVCFVIVAKQTYSKLQTLPKYVFEAWNDVGAWIKSLLYQRA